MGDDSIKDKEFESIVSDILYSDEFSKTKNIIHHGLNRYDHSVRVAHISYKIAKALDLSYEEVARGGLLHDFFLIDNNAISTKERMYTLVNHPKYALRHSEKYFDLTPKERDIIVSHMFPVAPTRVPKYLESWIVNAVDDVVSIVEEIKVKKKALIRLTNYLTACMVKVEGE